MNEEKSLTRVTHEDKLKFPKPNVINVDFKLNNVNIVLCLTLLIMFAIIAFTKPDSLNNVTIVVFIVAEIIAGFMPSINVNK